MSAYEVAVPPHLITLTCPTCGAKLKLGADTNLVYCTSCGNEHLVQRGDGSIYLAPMAANVAQIRTGVDKTAAELAVVRLTKELQELDQQLDAATKKDYSYLVGIKSADGGIGMFALLVLIVIVGLSFFPALTMGHGWIALTLIVVACVGFFVFVIGAGKQMDKRRIAANNLKEMACAPLLEAIAAKEAQLLKARQIANGAN